MNELTTLDEQVEMRLSKAANQSQEYISDSIVFNQPNCKSALGLSVAASGLDDQDIYSVLEIDAGQWSRITHGKNNFPLDKLGEFQSIVKNNIFIRYIAHSTNHEIKPVQTSLETQLEAANNKILQLKHDGNLMRELLKK